MADQAISFDRGVEVLRGPDAASKIAMRRAALRLAAMPDPFDDADDGFLVPDEFVSEIRRTASVETWDLPEPQRD